MLNWQNKTLTKIVAVILIQSFFFTGLIYPESINNKDMAGIYKQDVILRVPMANERKKKLLFAKRFLKKILLIRQTGSRGMIIASVPLVLGGSLKAISQTTVTPGIYPVPVAQVQYVKSEQEHVRTFLGVILGSPAEYITGWEEGKPLEQQNAYSRFIYNALRNLGDDIENGKVEIHLLNRFSLGLAGEHQIQNGIITIMVPRIVSSDTVKSSEAVDLISTTVHEYGHGLQWRYKLNEAMLKITLFAGDHQVRKDTEKLIEEMICKLLEAGINPDKEGQWGKPLQYLAESIGGAGALKNGMIDGESFAEYIWKAYANQYPVVNIWNIMEGFAIFEEHFDEIVTADKNLSELFSSIGLNKNLIRDMRLSFQKPERVKEGAVAYRVFDKDDRSGMQDFIHGVWQEANSKFEGKELSGAVMPFIENGVEKRAVYLYFRDTVDIDRLRLHVSEAFNAKDMILIHASSSGVAGAGDIVSLSADKNEELWIVSGGRIVELRKSGVLADAALKGFIEDIHGIRREELNPRNKIIQRFERYLEDNNLASDYVEDFKEEAALRFGITGTVRIDEGRVYGPGEKYLVSSSAAAQPISGRNDRDRSMMRVSNMIATVALHLTYLGDIEARENLRELSRELGIGDMVDEAIEKALEKMRDPKRITTDIDYIRLADLYFNISNTYFHLGKLKEASVWVNKLLAVPLDKVHQKASEKIKQIQTRGDQILLKIKKQEEAKRHESIHVLHAVFYGNENLLRDFSKIESLVNERGGKSKKAFYEVKTLIKYNYHEDGRVMSDSQTASEFYAWYYGLFSMGLLDSETVDEKDTEVRKELIQLFRDLYRSMDQGVKDKLLEHFVKIGMVAAGTRITPIGVLDGARELNTSI